MEPRNNLTGSRIERCDVASLLGVASKAGIGQVVLVGTPTVLAADDVVYLMGRIRIVFMKEAIFAPMRGAFCNESPLRFRYVTCQVACVDERAL